MHALSFGQFGSPFRRFSLLTSLTMKNILLLSSGAPLRLNPSRSHAARHDSTLACPALPSNRLRTSAIQHTPPSFKTYARGAREAIGFGGFGVKSASISRDELNASATRGERYRDFVHPAGSR